MMFHLGEKLFSFFILSNTTKGGRLLSVRIGLPPITGKHLLKSIEFDTFGDTIRLAVVLANAVII